MIEMNYGSLNSEAVTCIPLKLFIFQTGSLWCKSFHWFSIIPGFPVWNVGRYLLPLTQHVINHVCKIHGRDRYCFTSIFSYREL